MNMDRSLESVVRRAMDEPNQGAEEFGLAAGLPMWALFAYTANVVSADRQATIANFLFEYGLSWSESDARVDTLISPTIAKRGLTAADRAGYWIAAEHMAWNGKCAHCLASTKLEVATAEVVSSLPSVADVIAFSMTGADCCRVNTMNTLWNVFLSLAAVCEKFGQHEHVLRYAAAMFDAPERAGTTLPTTKVLGQSMQGRALAALGRTADAALALEAAAAEARRYGLRLWEAFALRDLKLLVLDGMGHADHAARRLGEVLRPLKGPAAMLTPMLKGLDAAELMLLPAPDADYHVAYSTEPPEVTALRQELQGLKLSALRNRCRATAALDPSALDEIMDSADNPRAALVAALVDRAASASGREHEGLRRLREELMGLKNSALRRRLVAESVDHEAIEAAEDSEDPRAAMLALLLARHASAPPSAEAQEVAEQEGLRAELAPLKLSTLRRRLVAESADHEAIEAAEDSEDPRAAMLALLLARHVSAPPSVQRPGPTPPRAQQPERRAAAKPHFAASDGAAAGPPRSARSLFGEKHCMLSYQWDCQVLFHRSNRIILDHGI
jgi:hypothetical protein